MGIKNTCSISRTTCRRSSRAAAASCRSNRQQQAPTRRSAVHPSLLGTRSNQRRPNEKIALIFFAVLFVRIQAEQQQQQIIRRSSSFKSRRPTYAAVAPYQTLDANRLGIILSSSYLHSHQASTAVSAPQQRPRQGSTVNKTSQR